MSDDIGIIKWSEILGRYDEQTDDLAGLPSPRVVEAIDRRAVVIPHEPRTPPCTGYEADAEFYTTTFGVLCD
jgi:hypothetical protein